MTVISLIDYRLLIIWLSRSCQSLNKLDWSKAYWILRELSSLEIFIRALIVGAENQLSDMLPGAEKSQIFTVVLQKLDSKCIWI